jgi:hypothetical protein
MNVGAVPGSQLCGVNVGSFGPLFIIIALTSVPF